MTSEKKSALIMDKKFNWRTFSLKILWKKN